MPPKKKRVSVGLQVVCIFIPFAWIWAFYRIEKLGKGVMIMIGGYGVAIILGVIGSLEDGALIAIFGYIGWFGYVVWLMVKWSDQWNESISKNPSL